MKKLTLLWLVIPWLNTAYQICVKLAAAHLPEESGTVAWLLAAAAEPWLWLAVLSEIASFVVWMQILSRQDLSKAFPLSALSYLLVLLCSYALFHEPLLPLQLLGSSLILCGVWLIGSAPSHETSSPVSVP